MPGDYPMIISVCLGLALTACCGFRIFIPLLGTSLAIHFGWITVPADMQWLGESIAIVCFSTAALIEIVAYYVPFLDNILDFAAAPLSIIAGTLLMFSLLPVGANKGLLAWGIALVAGGAPSGTIQIGSGLVRLFSTKATVGTGNSLVASAENTAAILGTILSFIIPVIMTILLVLLVLWIAFRTFRRLFRPNQRVF